jgi:predicted nucleotidyltransferase component of viral defense system
MNLVIADMLRRYRLDSQADYTRALREILQEVALLGLWRAKFFDGAAFYGGTALRVLYGLQRFSEDLDFSLLAPDRGFDLGGYADSLEREIRAFGFDVQMVADSSKEGAVRSAFLKADTIKELISIEATPEVVRGIPRGKLIKIKLEIDTEPPPAFGTEIRYLLQPVPFAVRVYESADLFAGKVHALLFRKWTARVKGRDWYDFVWFAGNRPDVHVAHLEQRMRQSGHWQGDEPLTDHVVRGLLDEAIASLDVERARREVEPFLQDPVSLDLWSREFFREVARRVRFV